MTIENQAEEANHEAEEIEVDNTKTTLMKTTREETTIRVTIAAETKGEKTTSMTLVAIPWTQPIATTK